MRSDRTALDICAPITELASLYLTQRFDCDGYAVGCFGPGPDMSWQTLISDGIAFDPESPRLKQLAETMSVTHPASIVTLGRNEIGTGNRAPSPVHMSVDGTDDSAVVLLLGRTSAGERFVIALLKHTTMATDYADWVLTQLRSGITPDALVHSLMTAAGIRRHVELLQRGYDKLRFATVFTDDEGGILFLNDCAHAILTRAFGRPKSETRPLTRSLVSPACGHFISSILAQLPETDLDHSEAGAETIWKRLPDQDERTPFYVVRLASGDKTTCGATCIIFPDKSQPLQPDLILEGLGLTASESRLAAHIISGKSLKVASHEMALSEESARTYLKRVFSKLGISRQAELVSTVAQLCGPIRTHAPADTRSRESRTNIRVPARRPDRPITITTPRCDP
ncbi:MAG: helix-turn-helix transcriptional regulator [Hyphomicrobium sp.]|nr:helix-turn-helix transcriptional regulator [Hyphomicrobium sp.]